MSWSTRMTAAAAPSNSTEALKPGTYVVVLRVRDAAGNIGSGDVVFTVKPEKAKP